MVYTEALTRTRETVAVVRDLIRDGRVTLHDAFHADLIVLADDDQVLYYSYRSAFAGFTRAPPIALATVVTTEIGRAHV